MNQSQHLRDLRNRHLYKLGRLRMLADAMQIEPAILEVYLDRLRTINQRKEVDQAHQWQSAVRADLTD